jgi:hypothetical protein
VLEVCLALFHLKLIVIVIAVIVLCNLDCYISPTQSFRGEIKTESYSQTEIQIFLQDSFFLSYEIEKNAHQTGVYLYHFEFGMCQPHANIIYPLGDRHMWHVTASREMIYVIYMAFVIWLADTFQTCGPDAN